jgi:cbb3-type cytochrome oxidase subunit 3
MSMYARFYSGMHFAALPVLAMLLFMLTFIAAVARVSQKSRRKELEAVSRLPLDDEHERVEVSGEMPSRAPTEPRTRDRHQDHQGARR